MKKLASLFRLLAIGMVIMALILPTAVLARPIPDGAKKIAKKKMFQVKDEAGKKFFCAKIGKKIIPGKKISGYFYSHQAEIKNLKAKLRNTTNKKQKKKIKKQIAKLKEMNAVRKDICLGGINPTPTPTPTQQPVALRFNFKDAVGVAISDSQSVSSYDESGEVNASSNKSSNLKKVDAFGNLKEAVSSGKANISKFFIADNNKLYLYFESKVNVADTNDNCEDSWDYEKGELITNENCCLLAEVNTETGEVNCVDTEVSEISWYDNGYGFLQPIQFDDEGAIYYLGKDRNYNSILKKYLNGVSTNFYSFKNDNTRIDAFLALADGSVVVYGYTESTRIHWLRKIRANGIGLTDIASGVGVKDLVRLNDGHIYYTAYSNVYGYNTYRTDDTFSAENKKLVIGALNKEEGDLCDEGELYDRSWHDFYDSENNYLYSGYLICKNGVFEREPDYSNFCNVYDGSTSYVSPSGSAFKLDGYSAQLYQWYPMVKKVQTQLSQITLSKGVGNFFVLGGIKDNRTLITLYNTDTDEEIELLQPGTYEPYHFNYLANSNKLIFDGLRFSDGKYVIGMIDLTTMHVTSVPTGTNGKLVDFSTFK